MFYEIDYISLVIKIVRVTFLIVSYWICFRKIEFYDALIVLGFAIAWRIDDTLWDIKNELRKRK